MEKLNCLIVDTSGFLNRQPLWNHAENLVTTKAVLEEIKDQALRDYVLAFPVPIKFEEPRQENLDFVVEFSKKTGDFIALSVTDIKVIALAYQIETQRNGAEHLRTQPARRQCNANAVIHSNVTYSTAEAPDSKPLARPHDPDETEPINRIEMTNEEDPLGPNEVEDGDVDEEMKPDEDKSEADDMEVADDDGWCQPKRKRGKKLKIFRQKKQQYIQKSDARSVTTTGSTRSRDFRNNLPGWVDDRDVPETVIEEGEENSEEEEDCDEGWATPQNIDGLWQARGALEHLPEDEDQRLADHPDVACMTGDFAMQNVLRHIGIAVVGIDGVLIKKTRCYVLRCHACFHVTYIMDKLFCPRCGHMTLKRVAMTTNEDGSQQIWISSKPLSVRGLKYRLPAPRGGKNAVLPLLTEDQRFPQQRLKKPKTVDMHNAQCIDDAPFAMRDISSRAFAQGNTGALGYKGHFTHAKIWRPKKRRLVQK